MSNTQSPTDSFLLEGKRIKDLRKRAQDSYVDRKGFLWVIINGKKIRIGRQPTWELKGEQFEPDPTHLL